MRKYNEKVQNSKSKPKKLSFLCTFKATKRKAGRVETLNIWKNSKKLVSNKKAILYLH